MVAKTPRLLTAEQRDAFVRIPADLSERDLGRFYTLSARDLEIIGRHRRAANRLGFAVHLGLLRFPGRTLADVPEILSVSSSTSPSKLTSTQPSSRSTASATTPSSSTSTSCGVSSAFRTAAGRSSTPSARS